jgi:GNAT superfamily N-acetyltransferase
VSVEPRLENGWEPDTPLADSLLRQFVFNQAATSILPVGAMGGRVLRRDQVAAADLGRPAGFLNSATLLQPPTVEGLAGTLDELDRFYRGGSGEVLLWSAWPTPDLRPSGWRLEGHPPLLVRPAGGEPPPTEVEIEPVRDAAALRVYEQTAIRGFPLPELAQAPPGSLLDERVLGEERLRHWLGRIDGEPVGTAATTLDSGLNGVALIVTLPEARRRGVGAALTWCAAQADPTKPAALLASDLGRGVYERMGFLPLLRFTLWSRQRPWRTARQ